jgi:TfoX/Sxy family transcriptional regulator of competence genes
MQVHGLILTLPVMAYDEGLAQRLREQLDTVPEITEKKMFGGLAFMERGNMLVGVIGDELIARVGPEATDASLAKPGARAFDFSGRPMKGWVTVGGPPLDEDDTLALWVAHARQFVATLPAK